MKVLLVFICIILQLYVIVQGFTPEQLQEMAVTCKDATGATDAHIVNFVQTHGYATSKEEKCFRACFMRKLGSLNENGKFVKEVGYMYSEKLAKGDANLLKLYKDSIDACVDITVPDDHCEASETYNICFIDASAARGVSFGMTD